MRSNEICDVLDELPDPALELRPGAIEQRDESVADERAQLSLGQNVSEMTATSVPAMMPATDLRNVSLLMTRPMNDGDA